MELPPLGRGRADYYYRLSEGSEGVRETMALMRQIVKRYRADPNTIQFARNLVRRLPQKDWVAEVRAIFRYVRDGIRYVLDPNDVETLTTPDRLIEIGQGDCDDKSILLSTLLEAAGYKTRFKAVGFTGGELSHVYVEVLLGNSWVALDPTELGDVGELAFAPAEVKNKWIVHI